MRSSDCFYPILAFFYSRVRVCVWPTHEPCVRNTQHVCEWKQLQISSFFICTNSDIYSVASIFLFRKLALNVIKRNTHMHVYSMVLFCSWKNHSLTLSLSLFWYWKGKAVGEKVQVKSAFGSQPSNRKHTKNKKEETSVSWTVLYQEKFRQKATHRTRDSKKAIFLAVIIFFLFRKPLFFLSFTLAIFKIILAHFSLGTLTT